MNLDFSSYITIPKLFSLFLHLAGIAFLYVNRQELLYDNEDGNPNTPNVLSLGRCWAWVVFYFACSYWIRYLTGAIPSNTPFPPALEEMLFACLTYEFLKKGFDLGRLWVKGKAACKTIISGRGNADEEEEDNDECNKFKKHRE